MLAKVARSLASVARGSGDLAEAERLYEESIPLLEEIGASRHLAHTLQYLAHLAQRRGDIGRAVNLSRESLERFQSLGGIRCYSEELQDLALLASRAGSTERALRLFGAAAAVREKIDFSLTAIEKRETDAELARCREAVGRDFERAMAEGRAMRVEDALEYAHDTLDSLAGPSPAPRTSPPNPQEAALRREGDVWSFQYAGESFRLRDTKGLGYLARLLREPGREFHALDLAGAPTEAAVERPVEALDATAREAYRSRLDELEEEEQEAKRFGDAERAARAHAEREFIAEEIARAYGLGGRARTSGSTAERARVAVTKAIRAALDRVREASPALGRHLEATVRTGMFCSYTPDPRAPITWRA
jgi:non-specific serine/threonine protein kinase